MTRKLFFIAIVIVSSVAGIVAQRPRPTAKPRVSPTPQTVISPMPIVSPTPMPAPTLVPLETIVSEAEKQTQNYRQEFNNLLGEETKTFETFDKNGKSKKRTIVESNFIAYQSPKDETQVVEYRNVVKVDGKSVGDSDKRATSLFENLAKSASAQQELENVQKESSRYDKTLDLSGFTLFQVPVLAEHVRPFFDFTINGEENIDGSDVYVVSYQQKLKSPFVILNDDQPKPDKLFLSFEVELPKMVKEPNALLRGKIWIDKTTYQIRRERRELTVQPAGSSNPLVINETELEYQPSAVGILTPKRIVFTDYNVKSKDKGANISAVLDTKATFVYTKFTKSDVEVKSGEVKN